MILSPSAWAVDADHNNVREPYGGLWMDSFAELARLDDVTVIGVSNMGWLTSWPWKGQKVIGRSLAVGPGGAVLARGPYGEHAEALVVVEVEPRPPIGRGKQFAGTQRPGNIEGLEQVRGRGGLIEVVRSGQRWRNPARPSARSGEARPEVRPPG